MSRSLFFIMVAMVAIRNKIHSHASYRIARNIRSGILERKDSCEICRSHNRVVAHHPDYRKPEDVVCLCTKCHIRLHREIKKQRKPEEANMFADLSKLGYWNCPPEPATNFETDFDYDEVKNKAVSRYEDEIYNEKAVFCKHVL